MRRRPFRRRQPNMISPIPLLSSADSFGPYRVLEDLGAVPYGTLYRVVDTRSEEPAMLKVIPPSLQGGWQGSAPWEILLRETHALARIYHRALPTLLEVSEHEGELLVAFSSVEGMSLRDWLADGGRPDRALLAEWGVEILEALQEAHSAGLLHRHLGEDEIFITAEGQVVLTGFGLTQLTFDPLVPLPPEQLAGDPFTEQSDLFALGALLHRLAFVSGLRGQPAEPGFGRDPLLKVVARATFADRSARFASAADMAEALRGRGELAGGPEALAEMAGSAPALQAASEAPRSVARFRLPGRAGGVREGEGQDRGGHGDANDRSEGDRRHALLCLASSILLLACLILAGWLVLKLEPADGPTAAPSAETVEAQEPASPRSPA